MSYKDMTTRRQIAKEHMEVFLSIEQGHLLHKQYLDKKASFQNSTTYEKDKARRLLLQELDKENNKTNPNNKKENILKFINKTIELITKEYNAINNTNKDEIVSIAKGFAPHIKKLKEFEHCNNTDSVKAYTIFCEKLTAIDPYFVELFGLETIQLLSL